MDFFQILWDIFQDKPRQQIEDIIDLVQSNENYANDDEMLEEMINLLIETGDSTLETNYFEPHQDQAAGLLMNQADLIYEHLEGMLPNADPDFLKMKSKELANKPENLLEDFIENALSKEDYPTKKEFLKRQRTLEEASIYTTNFEVEDYLKKIPDPFNYFYSEKYEHALTNSDINQNDELYALNTLSNNFKYLRERDIKKVFLNNKKNVIKTGDVLVRIPNFFKKPRPKIELSGCENFKLLQELAFVENKQRIRYVIKMNDEVYRIARAEAEKLNLLQTCQCCYDDSLIPEECYFCQKDCVFCKECVAKGAEVAIGEGCLVFPCLGNCDSTFALNTLRMVLNKKIFEPLIIRLQMEDLKKAEIPGLETCPFCDFSMILPNEEKIFKCQNVDCMEESCRQCRHQSHVPKKCNEIEYDEDVKKRTYIENKMTEGLLRKCPNCSKSFFKESGCNKMTCTCGYKMCYVCGVSVNGYNHFSQGNTRGCPLYSDDKDNHFNRIVRNVENAKKELGIDINPNLLKFDPSIGLENFYQQ